MYPMLCGIIYAAYLSKYKWGCKEVIYEIVFVALRFLWKVLTDGRDCSCNLCFHHARTRARRLIDHLFYVLSFDHIVVVILRFHHFLLLLSAHCCQRDKRLAQKLHTATLSLLSSGMTTLVSERLICNFLSKHMKPDYIPVFFCTTSILSSV